MIDIRKAGTKDIPGIIEINSIIDYDNPDDFMRESVEFGRVFVALSSQRVVGYILYQIIWGNTPFIALLKIHPDFQKQGLGSKLIDTFEREIRSLHFKGYTSSTGVENIGSKIFHQKKGFLEIGTLDMSFGGEIFYRKEL